MLFSPLVVGYTEKLVSSGFCSCRPQTSGRRPRKARPLAGGVHESDLEYTPMEGGTGGGDPKR